MGTCCHPHLLFLQWSGFFVRCRSPEANKTAYLFTGLCAAEEREVLCLGYPETGDITHGSGLNFTSK